METFEDFLKTIDDVDNKMQMKKVLDWVSETYPKLGKKIAWKQPMFTDHETFIIGFSIAKNNFAVAVEKDCLDIFRDEVENAGYDTTQQLIKIKWDQEVNYELLSKLIEFNIEDKKEIQTFFRRK